MKDRLRELRTYLNLKQAEFGKRLGLTHASISRFESGQTVITDQNVYLICLTFGVNEDWFRNGKGEMFDKEVSDRELKKLVDRFCQLQPETRKMVQEYADMLLRQEQDRMGKNLNDDEADLNLNNILRLPG